MIPRANITNWRSQAPWMTDEQVEQDLILSRILVEIFSDNILNDALAFRGGTALHKLFLPTPGRYSEDIDLVRTEVGSIKNIIDRIRSKLDVWLGIPSSKRNVGCFTLYYKFTASTAIAPLMRIKIEINTREHESKFSLQQRRFMVENPWFSGVTSIKTYLLEELLGTKLRALYQRKKGRDLFDLFLMLQMFPDLNINNVLQVFDFYLEKQNIKITRAQFEKNLYEKLQDDFFQKDMTLLLNYKVASDFSDFKIVADKVYHSLVKGLAGAPWKQQSKLLDLIS